MCGRFVGSFTMDDLLAEIGGEATGAGVGLDPSVTELPAVRDWNVAPTRIIPVLRVEHGLVTVEPMRWGLVPSWAKEPPTGRALVNARSETVHEKPSFRNLVAGHRCIVPMNGFYEWDRPPSGRKTPYYVPRADGRLLLCLAVWSRPQVMEGLATCAVLTRESAEDLADIHDRAPVHVDAVDAVRWLIDDEHPLGVLSAQAPLLAPYEVSSDVNSVRNNGEHLLVAVGDADVSDGPLFG